MDLSVVVPTLNGRERLAVALDSLRAAAPDAEVVVVNGPSADGTTGMVRDRGDVDVLVEVSARTLNVARNAGIAAASGDAIAFLAHDLVVETGWADAVVDGLATADVVTGPVRRTLRAGATSESPERKTICGREVTYVAGGNVAFHREALTALDGFDEYLETGGARDVAHRLAGLGRTVAWREGMDARRDVVVGVEADGGRNSGEWAWKYRSLAYRLAKNYGLRPTVVRRTVGDAFGDGFDTVGDVLRGENRPTAWVGAGRAVAGGVLTGIGHGMVARARDRTPRRNPNGVSVRSDRAVARYDFD